MSARHSGVARACRSLFPQPSNTRNLKKSIKVSTGALTALVISAVLFLYWPLFPRSVPAAENDQPVDVVLVGAGVMSATLATYLQELQPDWKIEVFERLDGVALESSNGWNNAGTGHSGFAELNYTPELPDGSMKPSAPWRSPSSSRSRASSGPARSAAATCRSPRPS